MKIILDTNDAQVSRHYLETLVLLYMPGEKFGLDDDLSELRFAVRRECDCIFGRAELCLSEKRAAKELSVPLSEYAGASDAVKCFCGRLFLLLFGEIFDYYPPWGILTGVRPARFALDLMKRTGEKNVEEILTKRYFVSKEKAHLAMQVAQFGASVIGQSSEKEYSLYIGIPFCPSRCRYCSFVSYATARLQSLLPDYISALSDEIDMLCETAEDLGLVLKSVYVGGGTPTVLGEKDLEVFLERLSRAVGDIDGTEFTFEAGRPDTVTFEKLKTLKEFGVTRISINTQTSNDEILASVGRLHTFDDYKRAYFAARDVGFSINTDLIAGLPGESTESFYNSIRDVLELLPDNITVHSFSLKKSSEYTVGGEKLNPADRSISDMLSYSSQKLLSSGYIPYYMYRQKNTGGNFENVGYTVCKEKAGYYNIYMMEGFHTVLAAGAGASSKLVSRDLSFTEKIYNPKYPYEYLSACDDILKNREKIVRFYENRYN